MQRGWTKGRDEYWKAEDMGDCMRDQYAMHIADLRMGYDGAREVVSTSGPSS